MVPPAFLKSTPANLSAPALPPESRCGEQLSSLAPDLILAFDDPTPNRNPIISLVTPGSHFLHTSADPGLLSASHSYPLWRDPPAL